MEIYIAKNKQQMGPYDIGQITQMLQSGILEKYDLYWHEGMLDWAPVASLAGAGKPPEHMPATYEPQSAMQFISQSPQQMSLPMQLPPHLHTRKSRVAYILLGLFLGGLGIHNFYAGYTGKGVAQLLITIFFGWLLFPLAIVGVWILLEIITETKDAHGEPFA